MIGRDEVIDVEGTRVLNMSGTIFNHANARLAASSEFKRTNVQEPGLCAVASSSPDFILCISYHRSDSTSGDPSLCPRISNAGGFKKRFLSYFDRFASPSQHF